MEKKSKQRYSQLKYLIENTISVAIVRGLWKKCFSVWLPDDIFVFSCVAGLSGVDGGSCFEWEGEVFGWKIKFDHKNICGIIFIIAANVIHCFQSLPYSPFGGDFLFSA